MRSRPVALLTPSLHFLTHLRRLGAALLLVSSVARAESAADPAPALASSSDSSTCAAAPNAAHEIPLAAAVFSPQSVDGALRWDARFVLDVDAAFDFRGGSLAFAVPLPPGEVLVPARSLLPITEGDRIVGLCIDRDALDDRTISASFVQPLRPSTPTSLGAPVVAGSTVQIVETSTGTERIEPVLSPPLEKHVSYVAPRAISDGAREEARRLTAVRSKVNSRPIYVRGDDVHALGGLSARIVDPRTRARESAVGVAIVFATVVGLLLFAARKLGRSASVERADALLASEIDDAARVAPALPKERC